MTWELSEPPRFTYYCKKSVKVPRPTIAGVTKYRKTDSSSVAAQLQNPRTTHSPAVTHAARNPTAKAVWVIIELSVGKNVGGGKAVTIIISVPHARMLFFSLLRFLWKYFK